MGRREERSCDQRLKHDASSPPPADALWQCTDREPVESFAIPPRTVSGRIARTARHDYPISPQTTLRRAGFILSPDARSNHLMFARFRSDDGKFSLDDSPKEYLPYFR